MVDREKEGVVGCPSTLEWHVGKTLFVLDRGFLYRTLALFLDGSFASLGDLGVIPVTVLFGRWGVGLKSGSWRGQLEAEPVQKGVQRNDKAPRK